MDLLLVLTGFCVGVVVGLTGMGGGALMTPLLVLLFGIQPLAAISSDLVAAAFMKPVGSAVHIRRGTVNWSLVRWLCVGSIPGSFGGVLIIRAVSDVADVETPVKIALGVALLIAATSLIIKAYVDLRTAVQRRRAGLPGRPDQDGAKQIKVRRVPTIIIGALGGVVVGLTSVGSGSLIIISLMLVYRRLTASQLVGTDLVQAVPLVTSASIGHILFGDFQFDLALSLVLGSLPGVYLGARFSSRAPDGLIRRALAFVLLASGLKLVGLATLPLGVLLAITLVAAPLVWMAARRNLGLPALARTERRIAAEATDGAGIAGDEPASVTATVEGPAAAAGPRAPHRPGDQYDESEPRRAP